MYAIDIRKARERFIMALHITTNNHVRPYIQGDFGEAIKYRGSIIELSDVVIAPDEFKALGYDGVMATSLWDGLAFRFFDRDGYDLDGVVVAHFYYAD
jgi:hypothetical protein